MFAVGSPTVSSITIAGADENCETGSVTVSSAPLLPVVTRIVPLSIPSVVFSGAETVNPSASCSMLNQLESPTACQPPPAVTPTR